MVHQIGFLFLDRAQETLGVAISPGFLYLAHADLGTDLLEHLDAGCDSLPDSLIGVMDLRALNQIGVTGQVVLAMRCLTPSTLSLGLQPHLSHQIAPSLVVYLAPWRRYCVVTQRWPWVGNWAATVAMTSWRAGSSGSLP